MDHFYWGMHNAKQTSICNPTGSPAPGDNTENGVRDIWRQHWYDVKLQTSGQGQKPGHATCKALSDTSVNQKSPRWRVWFWAIVSKEIRARRFVITRLKLCSTYHIVIYRRYFFCSRRKTPTVKAEYCNCGCTMLFFSADYFPTSCSWLTFKSSFTVWNENMAMTIFVADFETFQRITMAA